MYIPERKRSDNSKVTCFQNVTKYDIRKSQLKMYIALINDVRNILTCDTIKRLKRMIYQKSGNSHIKTLSQIKCLLKIYN